VHFRRDADAGEVASKRLEQLLAEVLQMVDFSIRQSPCNHRMLDASQYDEEILVSVAQITHHLLLRSVCTYAFQHHVQSIETCVDIVADEFTCKDFFLKHDDHQHIPP
jgi:hypothetical protein